MPATVFVPLTSKLIDEGEFLADLDLELQELQTGMGKYTKQFGEKAKGAKAKLTAEIELKCEDPEDEAYSVKVTMKTTQPKRPSSVSLAMGGVNDEGQLSLFVRKSGSDDSDPKQLKFATRDGRVVNPESGDAGE